MSEAGLADSRRDPRGLILLALAATYFLWGSTYLGIRFALEGFPPLAMNAVRFVAAGGLLYIWLRRRGAPGPTPAQWRNAAATGAILLVGGVGLVTVAEDLGVGSGVAASALAVMPLWAALWSGLFGQWPVRLEWLGLAIGLGGVALLAQEGDFQSTALGTLLMVVAPLLWAFGSVWSLRLDLPKNSMATAPQMLTVGPMFVVLALVFGESFDAAPSAKAWLAVAYLSLFGSVLAYSAYVFLLRSVRPTLATSYAYANPIVAIVLGVTIGRETISGPAWIALPLILVGLAIVGYAQSARARRPSRPPRSASRSTLPRPERDVEQ